MAPPRRSGERRARVSTQQTNGRRIRPRAFAHMGLLGEHASSFGTPRLGLRDLARSRHAAGVIEDDSMQALGAFVADALGLSIDAGR